MTVPRRYRVEHISKFRYDSAAEGCAMLLRLRPGEEFGQRVLSFSLRIWPAAASVPCSDAFGNRCHLLNVHRTHSRATVRASSEVQTAAAALPERMDANAWQALADPALTLRHWEFPGAEPVHPADIGAFGVSQSGTASAADRIPLSSIRALSSTLHAVFLYEPAAPPWIRPLNGSSPPARGFAKITRM